MSRELTRFTTIIWAVRASNIGRFSGSQSCVRSCGPHNYRSYPEVFSLTWNWARPCPVVIGPWWARASWSACCRYFWSMSLHPSSYFFTLHWSMWFSLKCCQTNFLHLAHLIDHRIACDQQNNYQLMLINYTFNISENGNTQINYEYCTKLVSTTGCINWSALGSTPAWFHKGMSLEKWLSTRTNTPTSAH